MQITINEDIAKKYGYSLYEVLLLLTIDIGTTSTNNTISEDINFLESTGSIGTVLDNNMPTNNKFLLYKTKEDLTTILVESEKCIMAEDKLTTLARELKEVFPKGLKPGTTLYWAEGLTLITRRLRLFFRKYKVDYSHEQIVEAAKDYVQSFNGNYTYMHVLKYFICKDKIGADGCIENESQLINYVENKGQVNLNQDWTSSLV